jgi:hypothetical protein
MPAIPRNPPSRGCTHRASSPKHSPSRSTRMTTTPLPLVGPSSPDADGAQTPLYNYVRTIGWSRKRTIDLNRAGVDQLAEEVGLEILAVVDPRRVCSASDVALLPGLCPVPAAAGRLVLLVVLREDGCLLLSMLADLRVGHRLGVGYLREVCQRPPIEETTDLDKLGVVQGGGVEFADTKPLLRVSRLNARSSRQRRPGKSTPRDVGVVAVCGKGAKSPLS